MYVNKKKMPTTPPKHRVGLQSFNLPSSNKILEGQKRLGKGAYGVVNTGYIAANMKNRVVVKTQKRNAGIFECDVTKYIHSLVPEHVTKVRDCSSNGKMVAEYIHGGTFASWVKKNKNLMRDEHMQDFLKQLIKAFQKIHQKCPSFRHHDLHMDNVFVDDTASLSKYKYGIRLVIGDFGLSCTDRFVNPEYDKEFEKNWGIYPGSDYMYDLHLFFNSLHPVIYNLPNNLARTMAFLMDVLKDGYMYEKNTHVNNFRLKPGAIFPWNFNHLLSHEYFKQTPKIKKLMSSSTDAWKKVQAALGKSSSVKVVSS